MRYVFRDGKVVPRQYARPAAPAKSDFPTPMLSTMAPYESPITGREVSSWGERDRELREHDCYDPRDLPRDHVFEKSLPLEERVKHARTKRRKHPAYW